MLRQGIAVLFAAWAACAGAQVDPARSVIVVNGEEVKGDEYYRRMEFLPQVGRFIDNNYQEAPPGFLTLQTLIEEKLILQLAREKKVFPTDVEVQALMKEREAQDPGFIERYLKQGIPKADLDQQARLEVAQFKLMTMGIMITDMEVEKHYKDNPSRFTTPKRYVLRIIAAAEADKNAIDAELQAGAKFEDVAKKHSLDPSKLEGGNIGAVPEDAFAPGVKKTLESTKIGQATDWIKGETSWVKFFVSDIQPAKLLPLDDNLKNRLRRSLMMDKGQVKNDFAKMMREMRAKAVIQLKQPQFESDVKKMLDSYKLP